MKVLSASGPEMWLREREQCFEDRFNGRSGRSVESRLNWLARPFDNVAKKLQKNRKR